MIGAKLKPLFFYRKFNLINKNSSRIKVFESFEDSSNPSTIINAIIIFYGCVYKRSSKPVMKGYRVEFIEGTRKEYKKLLEEGWGKTYRFNSLKKWWIGTLPKI